MDFISAEEIKIRGLLESYLHTKIHAIVKSWIARFIVQVRKYQGIEGESAIWV